MRDLKDAIVLQNKAFMENLETINSDMIESAKDMRQRQNDLLALITSLKVRSQDQKGNIDELFLRMDTVEEKL